MILNLPSNSSSQFYPENTASSYTTHLPIPLDLKGEHWEVGLVEMSYTNSLHNVIGAKVIVQDKSKSADVHSFDLKTGYYQSPKALFQDIAQLVENVAGSRVFQILTDPVTQKTVIQIRFDGFVQFTPDLASMLGFERTAKFHGIDKVYESQRAFDLRGGVYGIYVYCDLVEPAVVGHTLAPLLRVVPVEGERDGSVTKTYDKIIYLPLATKYATTIKIDLRTDTGQKVPFAKGKTNCVLHIRRQRTSSS